MLWRFSYKQCKNEYSRTYFAYFVYMESVFMVFFLGSIYFGIYYLENRRKQAKIKGTFEHTQQKQRRYSVWNKLTLISKCYYKIVKSSSLKEIYIRIYHIYMYISCIRPFLRLFGITLKMNFYTLYQNGKIKRYIYIYSIHNQVQNFLFLFYFIFLFLAFIFSLHSLPVWYLQIYF